MKRLLYASLFAASAALSLSSCIRNDYDADPNSVSTATNPLTQTTGNGGGTTGGTDNSFNWSGTDPVSCKIDGKAWQAKTSTYMPMSTGYPAQVTGTADDGSFILINIPNNATLNTTYSFSSNLTASYSSDPKAGDPELIYNAGLGGGGQVIITEEDAAHIKGKFFFSAKNFSGKTTLAISEGYFNVTK